MNASTLSSRYDLIVVGSGVAGLYAALLAAAHGRVLLLTKNSLEESNTRYAQGGIAVALAPDDSPELHRRDTLAAGDGICLPNVVAALTGDAPDAILDLIRLGVPFDRDGDELARTLEAAHSRPRVLHAGGDATGAGIERTLAAVVRGAGIDIAEHVMVTALRTARGRVTGVEALSAGGMPFTVEAGAVLLATGGAGRLFARTTNPEIATGDGLALAYRAGAELMDLEFFQFHPTALALPGEPSFLISEAVRGEGGILRDRTGHAFMAEYHPDRELAPRDVVARAIHRQMEKTGSHVFLDVTHLDPTLIERRFPGIVGFCRARDIDPVRVPIPVAPAAHYFMGGICTDTWGRTSLPGLYACGEVACTGVHGANRLASNSLLEGLVFARRFARALAGDAVPTLPAETTATLPAASILDRSVAPSARAQLAECMWRHASLIRSADSLRLAAETLHSLPSGDGAGSREEHETSNLALVGQLLLHAAGIREESRGAHYRSDYPRTDAGWLGHTVLQQHGAGFLPLASAVPEYAR